MDSCGFKAFLVAGTNKPLLNWSDHLISERLWIIPVYLMMVPMQNFIFRSCLQGVLLECAVKRTGKLAGMIIASLTYSAFHWHISPVLVLVTILPGLIWGALYWLSQSLLAPVLSHVITGLIAFYIIGFHELTEMVNLPGLFCNLG